MGGATPTLSTPIVSSFMPPAMRTTRMASERRRKMKEAGRRSEQSSYAEGNKFHAAMRNE
jgi:hypothetical protein